ncbi:peptidoglycan/LPS O-acetylase OafA/YrhL [Novosphingobium sp. PhB165]|uniref:acyltransferase family protein n=1 Tax=Novosphingobium sp. PhB165 TaxID=2485105 RepID=UPI0010472542|nr:acyltransferase [Novosphingobium sp. PhB165]TCM17874.1 peptidoglycan/LPS O-acetylase OafA/YrhL [Novosphingobium sp. PhB165]
MATKRVNYTIVQGLRGFASIAVLLFHAIQGGHVPSILAALPFSLINDFFAVSVFFTLSGFVTAHGLAGVNMTPAMVGRFMLGRSIRLDPAYWASMLVAIAFVLLAAIVHGRIFHLPTIGELLAHVFYLQEMLGIPEINIVYWTLTYEFQFYLIFALSLTIRSRWMEGGTWALAMLSALGLVGTHWHGFFVEHWAVFYVGVIARRALDSQIARVGLALLVVALLCGSGFERMPALVALLLFVSAWTGWAETGLNWRWLQFLGAISYSLYLVHVPLMQAVDSIVHRLFGHGMAADLICLVLILAASITAAVLLYHAIERPSHRLARAIRSRPAPEPLILPTRPLPDAPPA